jgi:hypothetical protein
MSYDLCFWKERPGPRQNPQAVYEALLDGQRVDGLLLFPTEEYLAAVREAFPEAAREDRAEELTWLSDRDRSSFSITWSPVHVLVNLRAVSSEVGNRLVEIAASFDAPVYDPQTGERFDSWIDG